MCDVELDDCRILWNAYLLRKLKDATYNLVGRFGTDSLTTDLKAAQKALSYPYWLPPTEMLQKCPTENGFNVSRSAQRWWYMQDSDEVELVCEMAGQDYHVIMRKMVYIATILDKWLPAQYSIEKICLTR